MATTTTNEEIVRRYAEASAANDFEALAQIRHPEWQALWPQSGERVVGHACWVEMAQRYPGGAPQTHLDRLVGSEDRWFITPGNTVTRIAGTGDFWWGEWRMTFPDERVYQCVALIEMRDGLIWRETVYWAEPFAAPDWRRPFVDPASVGPGVQ
jgi:hypothetical protein